MPHEMTEHDQMYSVREAPWHLGSGTNVLMLDAAPETRMARIDAAGHAFTVEENDVHLRKECPAGDDGEPDVTFPKVEGWKALTRSDTGDVLNVARGSYEVVQNIVGHELFEALSTGARLDDGSGGTVKAGAVCYLSARVDEPQTVTGDDSPIYPYVVVLWTHDGSGALQARRTSVRPVCWNTISLGEAEARRSGRNFTFQHTKNVLARIEEAKRVIAGAREETAAFVELANELARMSVSDEQRERFVTTFIPKPEAEVISDQVLDNILRERAKVRAIFDGPTIPEAHRNTAYGLVQAGIEYLDHLRSYRNSDTYLGRTLLRDEPLKRKLVPMVRELAAATPRAA
jgi:phage/plasmid-like protein (TIGR03299 family)